MTSTIGTTVVVQSCTDTCTAGSVGGVTTTCCQTDNCNSVASSSSGVTISSCYVNISTF